MCHIRFDLVSSTNYTMIPIYINIITFFLLFRYLVSYRMIFAFVFLPSFVPISTYLSICFNYQLFSIQFNSWQSIGFDQVLPVDEIDFFFVLLATVACLLAFLFNSNFIYYYWTWFCVLCSSPFLIIYNWIKLYEGVGNIWSNTYI